MLDLEEIKKRVEMATGEYATVFDTICVAHDAKELLAEIERLTQPYVKEGIRFCGVCGTTLGTEEE